MMGTYKTVALALAAWVGVLAAPASAQVHPREVRSLLRLAAYGQSRGPEHTERFSRTFQVPSGATLDLSNVAGDITVTGTPGGPIQVDAVKRVRARDDAEARRHLNAVSVEATERAGRVDVRTNYTERNIRASVDYTVTVPNDASVYLHSVSGTVKVTNVRGELRADSVSGDVTGSDLGRQIFLKSVSGDVHVTSAAPEAQVVAESVSGDVTTNGLTVRTLEFSSVSGDVRASDVRAEEARLGTMTGSVEYAGPLAPRGRYSFKSHSGGVRLSVPGENGFQVDATSFSGSIRSDWPVTAHAGSDTGGRRQRFEQTLRGTYGDGSAVLQIRTFSGNIIITKH